MIAKLTGIVDFVDADRAVIDVSGVGYLLRASARTLAALPPRGAAASLAVETTMRENAIELYGFATPAERDWFRLLTTVQGVGARVAMAILSALSPDDLARAIADGDKTALTRADGVGPKLANRLASELKDKAPAPALAARAPAASLPTGPAADAVSALVNLGYRRLEAASAIERVAARLGAGARVEQLIPAGLRELGA